MAGVDSIEGSGFPLGFQASAGERRPSILGTGTGREIYVVEARKLAGHQKEAVVREGEGGSAWRLASDEGKHLKGTDLAPFPLGYFNAGLHADLMGRIVALADARSIALDRLSIELKNGYYMTGSFFRGDGHGYGEPAAIRVAVQSGAPADRISELVADADEASPALAAMRTPLAGARLKAERKAGPLDRIGRYRVWCHALSLLNMIVPLVFWHLDCHSTCIPRARSTSSVAGGG